MNSIPEATIDQSGSSSLLENPGQGRRFRLKDFEGPLDLLLFLIKRNDMNIYDIHIASITEQYLDCLKSEEGVDLDDLSEFYNLAATLLLIKSRMLLPLSSLDEEDFDDPRQSLIEKLIEYQKYKKLSNLMEQREMEVEWRLERSCMQRILPFPEVDDADLWADIDVWDLLKTFSSLVNNFNSEKIIDLYEEISIHEKLALMYELLEKQGDFSFVQLITRPRSALDLACAFLAMLDAVKNKIIRIKQHRLFGDILISPYTVSEACDG
ncbi:MAG: segregation/condensation protein A [Spirochaetia bacterium]|jgi:segregation and condensation protein A|nr:segregation/condensation protein A [Spirochaetia bacterium]